MPTFTAIALDQLLEPGASKSVDKSVPNSKPPNSRPIPNSNLERRNNTPATERRVKRPQITPALYATPKATPLPGSPTSFTSSPYIINHKRRGPRLVKSFSEDDVTSRQKTNEKVDGSLANVETDVVHSVDDISVTFTIPGANEECVNGHHDCEVGSHNSEFGFSNGEYGSSNGELKSSSVELGNSGKSTGVAREDDLLKPERDEESDSFFDPQESLSITSNTDADENSGAEHSMKPNTQMGEFFDAREGSYFIYLFIHSVTLAFIPAFVLIDRDLLLIIKKLVMYFSLDVRKYYTVYKFLHCLYLSFAFLKPICYLLYLCFNGGDNFRNFLNQ